jgi:hypothetical protein
MCAGSLIKPLERERVVANASANSSDGNIRARECAKRERRTFFVLSGGVGERVSCVKVTLHIRSFCTSPMMVASKNKRKPSHRARLERPKFSIIIEKILFMAVKIFAIKHPS